MVGDHREHVTNKDRVFKAGESPTSQRATSHRDSVAGEPVRVRDRRAPAKTWPKSRAKTRADEPSGDVVGEHCEG